MKLYTTTQHKLARQVRAYFNITNTELALTKFSDGEAFVTAPEDCAQQTAVLIQALSSPVNDAIVHTVFALEALKTARAASVILIITYLGYSRQDRQTQPSALITCSVVCKLLCLNTPASVYLLEPHAPQALGFLSVPSFAFGLTPVVCEHISRQCDLSDLVVIALDCGSVARALKVSRALGVNMISGYKQRDGGRVSVAFQHSLMLAGKTGVIIDDMIDTGKSVSSAIQTLLTTHSLRQIRLYCVHGVLSGKRAMSCELYVSNSIPYKAYSISVDYFISRLLKRVLAVKPHNALFL